jgi:hypothetical protein
MNAQGYMRDDQDPGSARVSRAGEHVLVIANFPLSCESHGVVRFNESPFRRDAETNTRDACATRT